MNTLKTHFTVAYWKELLLTFWQAMGTKKFWKELIISFQYNFNNK